MWANDTWKIQNLFQAAVGASVNTKWASALHHAPTASIVWAANLSVFGDMKMQCYLLFLIAVKIDLIRLASKLLWMRPRPDAFSKAAFVVIQLVVEQHQDV